MSFLQVSISVVAVEQETNGIGSFKTVSSFLHEAEIIATIIKYFFIFISLVDLQTDNDSMIFCFVGGFFPLMYFS